MALDPITAGIDLAKVAIEKIWPDKTEAEKQQLAAAVQMVQGQLDINRAEAASGSVFVGGWRPFIGWCCGAAFAWNWVGMPMVQFAAAYSGHAVVLAQADMSEMMPVLLGMLGLGALRTTEKIKGVARA
jgi:hypothetical protein